MIDTLNLITVIVSAVSMLGFFIYFFYNLSKNRNVFNDFLGDEDLPSFVQDTIKLISNQVSEHNYFTRRDTFVKKDNKVSSPLVFDPLNDASERIFCDYCGNFETREDCDIEDGKIIMFCTSCHYTNEFLTRQTSS